MYFPRILLQSQLQVYLVSTIEISSWPAYREANFGGSLSTTPYAFEFILFRMYAEVILTACLHEIINTFF